MFVNPDVIKTTSFLISDGERIGTVFFVEVGLSNDPENSLFGSAFYAVTAKHCIHDPLAIRFPLVSGGTENVETLSADWITHGETDVAVLPLRFSLKRYDVKPLVLRKFASDRDHLARFPSATEDTIPTLQYGTGDEVFSPGLFRPDVGPEIVQPMVRFGHVALKPAVGEKVFAEIEPKDYVPIDAFLVELSTWKGQSGSPIFMNPWEPEFRRPDAVELEPYSFLVGMIQGFYPAEENVEINDSPAKVSGLNTGIGIVIPAEYIRDVLMSERLKKDREAMLSERSKPIRFFTQGDAKKAKT
jgi:hypothetical protein